MGKEIRFWVGVVILCVGAGTFIQGVSLQIGLDPRLFNKSTPTNGPQQAGTGIILAAIGAFLIPRDK